MARTQAKLPQGSRITDYISLGVIANDIPVPRGSRTALQGDGHGEPAAAGLAGARAWCTTWWPWSLYMQSSAREVLRCVLEAPGWQSALAGAGEEGTGARPDSGIFAGAGRGWVASRWMRLARRVGPGPLAEQGTRWGVVPAVAVGEHRRQHCSEVADEPSSTSRRSGGLGGEPGAQRVPARYADGVAPWKAALHVLFAHAHGQDTRWS